MLPYIEPKGESIAIPFARYLPQPSPGVVKSWLAKHAPKESMILEPIGASPSAILEMAEAGFKVLAAMNNPVTAFELTMLARAPSRAEFESALGELAIQKKGTERLGTHILNLYLTQCASCGKEIPADAFLWRRSESTPFARIYHCPACGDEGEHPVTDFDVDKLAHYKRSDLLHRSRALERVPGGTKEAREYLEEVLNIYSARPLYALFTLINKLEGMDFTPKRRALLDALILSALDAGHSLWSGDETNDRPRAINIPPVYIERNLWLTIEGAIDHWCRREIPILLTQWPELPDQSGISLYQGRMRDLGQKKPAIQLQNIVCILPQPSQVFWTLSTLWSAWLWGKENAANLKNVLERQRFDWYWHTNALQSALAPAARMAKPGSSAFCILPEPVPGFISAAFEAGCASNLSLTGFACKDEGRAIQTEWLVQPGGRETKKSNLHKIIRDAVHDCLSGIGEPCCYQRLFTAVNASLACSNAFPAAIQQLTYEAANEIHGEIAKVFADRKFLRRLDNTAQDLESGYWWLTQPEGCQVSLADRVESEVVARFQKASQMSSSVLQKALNGRFTGYLTPPEELLEQCLQSYAVMDPSSRSWMFKQNEISSERTKDLEEMKTLLKSMADRFNLETSGENPILWFEKKHPEFTRFQIYISTMAVFSHVAHGQTNESPETIFLFPGGRSALLRFKLDRDPYLREKVFSRWHFLKFRALRDFAATANNSLDFWLMQLDSDPIRLEETIQLSMFGNR